MTVRAGTLFTIDAGSGGEAPFIHGPYLAKQDLVPQNLLVEYAQWVVEHGQAGVTRLAQPDNLKDMLTSGYPGDHDQDATAFVGWLESTDKAVYVPCGGFTVSSAHFAGRPRTLTIGEAKVELPEPFPGPLGAFGR